jgi:hypothetical protein
MNSIPRKAVSIVLLLILFPCASANLRHLRRGLQEEIPSQDIRGGELINALPYYGIFLSGPEVCSASLIWNDIALTAAHCLDSGLPSQIRFNSNDRTTGGVVANVLSATFHPGFTGTVTSADIAIIKLGSSLSLGRATLNQDAEIPSTNGESLFVMGHGIQADGQTTATIDLYGTGKF